MFFEQLIESIEEHRTKNHPGDLDRYHENPVIEAVAPSETDGGAKSASDQTETVKWGFAHRSVVSPGFACNVFVPADQFGPPG